MKKILFFSLILACLFSFGKCNKKKKCCAKKGTTTAVAKLSADEIWMRYNETKCENPWQLNWFQKPTEAQLRGAVKSQLSGQEINILEILSTYEEGFISCEACTCPNGRHYFVRINKSEIEKLKALKFFEVKDVPKTESPDTTK
jgi:hypothetical protein